MIRALNLTSDVPNAKAIEHIADVGKIYLGWVSVTRLG